MLSVYFSGGGLLLILLVVLLMVLHRRSAERQRRARAENMRQRLQEDVAPVERREIPIRMSSASGRS